MTEKKATQEVSGHLQTILKAGIYFGEEMLHDYGEFYPFGFALKKDGSLQSMGAINESDNPMSEEVIKQLKDVFIQSRNDEDFVVFAVFFDVEITEQETQKEISAIAAFTEHRSEDISRTYYNPYEIKENKVIFIEEENFEMQGESEIFAVE